MSTYNLDLKVLKAIRDDPGMSLSDLVGKTGIPRATIARSLERLRTSLSIDIRTVKVGLAGKKGYRVIDYGVINPGRLDELFVEE